MDASAKQRTADVAQGRWVEILTELEVPKALLNRRNQPCPRCEGTDRFRFTDYKGRGCYICTHCGAGDGFQLLMLIRGWDWATAASEVDKIVVNLPAKSEGFERRRGDAQQHEKRMLWRRSTSITEGDRVDLYLRSRNIWIDGYLGLSHVLRCMDEGMLAVFFDVDGTPVTIHRTYLDQDGRKCGTKFMPGELPAGGAIRLSNPNEDHTHIGIAEGIETALSASALYGGIPVWAAAGDAMLKAWMPPPEAKEILIFADNDHSYAGQAAAYALAKRLVAETERDHLARSVSVIVPADAGMDFNDILMKRGLNSA